MYMCKIFLLVCVYGFYVLNELNSGQMVKYFQKSFLSIFLKNPNASRAD